MERFSRIIQVIGGDSFQRLQNAHITIFGLGAVGAWAAEMLARSGLGHFTLVDFDQIAKTNINRHVCAAESTIGIPKVKAVKSRILDINPRAQVKALKLFADYTNRNAILDENPDIVIDAIDSLGPKAALLEAIHQRGLRAISSMGAALKTDITAVHIGDLFKTTVCPLARSLRKYLRRRGIDHGILCVYSTEQPDPDALKAPELEINDEQLHRGRERNILGSYPPVTAVFGITIADLAIKMICHPELVPR